MSKFTVAVAPADFPSWQAASDHFVVEATAPLKAELKRALKRANGDEGKVAAINAEFVSKIEKKQAEMAHTPVELHMQLKHVYNFL